jgi:hypothetical protein
MKNWRKVYETPNQHRAHIVQSVLATHALPAVIVNKKDTTYHFGHFEVHVDTDNILRALKIIADEIQFE